MADISQIRVFICFNGCKGVASHDFSYCFPSLLACFAGCTAARSSAMDLSAVSDGNREMEVGGDGDVFPRFAGSGC